MERLLSGILLSVAGPVLAASASTLAITDAGVTEGNTAVFAVTLDSAASQTVTVDYALRDVTARAIEDYFPGSGRLTFAPGETVKIITVPTVQDSATEHNEFFEATLSAPSNATIADDTGTGKITNQRLPYLGLACVTEFSAGFVGHPGGLVLDPDGNLWATEQFDAKLAKFDTRTLTATEIPLPPGTLPHFITVGPDGNLWFTTLDDKIGTVNRTTAAVRLFGGITPGSVPHFLLPAPDGNFYFSEQAAEPFPQPGNKPGGAGRLARFDPRTGTVTEFFGLLPEGNRIHGLNIGPDGQVWACLEGLDQLARFNLATQTFDRFVSFSKDSGPHDAVVGPDGRFYVTLQDANRIGRYDPVTGEVREFEVPGLSAEDGPSVTFPLVSPDGKSIWFSQFLNDRVGRFDIATQEFTQFFSGISANSAPIEMQMSDANTLWFAEAELNPRIPGRIGRLVTLGPDSPPCVSIEPAALTNPAPAVVHFDAVFPGGRASVTRMTVTANGRDITADLDRFVTFSTDTTWSATIASPFLPPNTRSTLVFTVETSKGAASDTLVIDTGAAALAAPAPVRR